MRAILAAVLLLGALTGPALGREPQRSVEEARARSEHHLREVNRLADHFEQVLDRECPRFATPREWRTYLDGEMDMVVCPFFGGRVSAPLTRADVQPAKFQQQSTCAPIHPAFIQTTARTGRIDWDQLRVLLAIADRGSLARAARALGVDQIGRASCRERVL